MNDFFLQYYRCPEQYVAFAVQEGLSGKKGYFKFGEDAVCYGACSRPHGSHSLTGHLHDASGDVQVQNGLAYLPFDPSEVVDDLRLEKYVDSNRASSLARVVRRAYYLVRPLLPVKVRKHFQKAHLAGWDQLEHPRWPVDRSVDNLLERLLLISLQTLGVDRIPFIWFWPDGASSCALMTHDVETTLGRDFSSTLMDINDSFGIKASFQVVPEKRYEVPASYLTSIRERGFEVNVQDLNHDGLLFSSREKFLDRVQKINAYGREYQADGFRSAVLYRQQAWYDALDFSYDTSVPNVAHLDPQRGGCCTVMPYFVGKLLELPVTTTQDYPLFHILNDYSIELWKQQSKLIMEKNGLINFIVHPDYITESRERTVYENLLEYIVRLRDEMGVWQPTPREACRWWRQRSAMALVKDGGSWRIEGEGKERAQVAYASQSNGQIEYTFSETTAHHCLR